MEKKNKIINNSKALKRGQETDSTSQERTRKKIRTLVMLRLYNERCN